MSLISSDYSDSKRQIIPSTSLQWPKQACDDDAFLLTEKVQVFLDRNCQVMIILEDSGAGKSTFNRHLELKLPQAYHSGDPIRSLSSQISQ
jgi:hypothetical protein